MIFVVLILFIFLYYNLVFKVKIGEEVPFLGIDENEKRKEHFKNIRSRPDFFVKFILQQVLELLGISILLFIVLLLVNDYRAFTYTFKDIIDIIKALMQF